MKWYVFPLTLMLWLSRLLYLIPLPFPFPSSLPTSWWEKPPLCGSYKGKKTAHNLRNPVGCVPQSKSESEWGRIPVPVTWSIYYIPAQPQVMIVWTMIQVYELPTKNIFLNKKKSSIVLILQSTLQFEKGYCHSTITQLLHPFAMKVSECWRIEQVIV